MFAKSFVVLAVTCMVAGVATADPHRDFDRREEPFVVERPEITLYDHAGFQGKSRHWNGEVKDLSDKGFNDRAQSVRVHGRWRICTDEKGRGRCLDVLRDIPDLSAVGMANQISSFSYIGRLPEPPPPPPVLEQPEALRGATAALFLRPRWHGDLLPPSPEAANAFCRDVGYRDAIHADYTGPVLSDLVCRR